MNSRIHFVHEDPLGRRLQAEAMANQPEFSASLFADIMKSVQYEHCPANAGKREEAKSFSAKPLCAAGFIAALLLVSVVVTHTDAPGQADPARDSATRQAIASADIAASSAAEELDHAAQSAVDQLSDSLVLVHWDYVVRTGTEITSLLLDSLPVDALPADALLTEVPYELTAPKNHVGPARANRATSAKNQTRLASAP